MPSASNPARIEQQQTLTNPLHPIFAGLALSYGMVMQDAKYGELSLNVLECLVTDCEELLALSLSLRAQFREVQP
ncbi:hypothetical protein ACH50O_15320 [Methylomonas sp. 2BW1-5-20]|uniref:hypothetical protein n=1 Tax=Methylomonas sp. 2BW1-5-20 TaxID=3376686 RepID=UPI00404EBC0D